MNRALIRTVWQRAADRFECCLIPKFALPLPFQIDHIIAEKHGGKTVGTNLALACAHCNRFKGPNIAGSIQNRGRRSACFTHVRTGGRSILSLLGHTLSGALQSVVQQFKCWR